MGLPTFSLLWTSRATALLSRLLLVFSVAALVGCGTTQPEYDPTSNWNAERLFQEGKTEMNGANWRVAKERFLAVESRFPFGIYAQHSHSPRSVDFSNNTRRVLSRITHSTSKA